MTPDELFGEGWRRADEALASGEWPPLSEQQVQNIAALIGPDLRRIRAGSRTPDSPTPRRAA